jgi:hypothetical protein
MSSKLDFLKLKYGNLNSKEDVKKRLMKALTKGNETQKQVIDDD